MSLLKKLALMLQDARKRRPYYCEVECLIGTGEQYIDLGLYGTTQSTIDIVFGMSSTDGGAVNNGAIFGGRTAQTSNTFTMFKLASATPQYFRFDYNGQKQVATANQITWNTTSKYRLQYDGTKAIITNITTRESRTENVSPPSSTTTSTICLFCVNTSGTKGTYYKGPIYRCQYSDGTNSVDVIPVLDWNMNPCMYDKINGVFYYNQGSGTFQYGREIHYVDYLEATGTQYIDTGYPIITSTDTLSITYENTSTINHKWLMGSYEPGAQIGISSATVTAPTIWYKNKVDLTQAEEYYNPHTLLYDSNGVSNDGVNKASFQSFTGTWNIYLFALNNTGTSPNGYFGYGKIYSYTHKRNNVLIRDYLPAIDENGVGFMFDRVTHTCFLNAGTGVFKYPARELTYLQTTGTQYIDTGYKAVPATTKFEFMFQCDNISDSTFIFGARPDTSATSQYTCATYKPTSRIRQDWAGLSDFFTGITTTDKYLYTAYNNTITLNDTTVTGTISRSTTRSDYNFLLFTVNTGGTADSRMFVGKGYRAKLWDNGTLVRNYSPVFLNGSAGMLDKVNNVFYGNAGTGTFGVGKIVEKEYE